MNKNELVDFIAEQTELPKAQAEKALNAFLEGVSVTLKNGDKVSLVGFGNFGVSHRKASTGRNPRTGEEIKIPAANRVKFTPGKQLKEVVNK